ncbi:MAG TPA: hypothetical protein VJ723_15610, partial [Candidatus Angelobacter sp.]|nr:hypothetical protein [Candidatus Angelobacter sp.]
MTAITAILLVSLLFPCYLRFVPCSEFSKSGDRVAPESSAGPSLLVIAVIGKPRGTEIREFFPVIFPVSRNL